MNKITLSLVCFISIAFIALATAFFISQPEFRLALSGTDFRGHYTGALMASRGEAKSLYDLKQQYKWQKSFLPELTEPQLMVYSYYPLVTFFLSPLGLFTFGNAYRVALVINFLLLLYMIRISSMILMRSPQKKVLPHLFAVFAFFLPVWFALLQNQFTFLLFVIFYYLWKFIKENKHLQAGLLMAALIIKPHYLIVPLITLALVGNRKILKGFAIGSAAVGIATIALYGIKGIQDYVSFLALLSRVGDAFTIHTAAEPTIKGFLHLLLHTDMLPPFAVFIYVVIFIAFLVRLFYLGRAALHDGKRFDIWYAAIILATLLTSPHTNGHDLTFLLFFLFMLLRYLVGRYPKLKLYEFPQRKKLTWYGICFVVFLVTISWVFIPHLATLTMFLLFLLSDYIVRHDKLPSLIQK